MLIVSSLGEDQEAAPAKLRVTATDVFDKQEYMHTHLATLSCDVLCREYVILLASQHWKYTELTVSNTHTGTNEETALDLIAFCKRGSK